MIFLKYKLLSVSLHYFQDELDKFDSLYLSAKARNIKNEELVLEEVDNKLTQLLKKYDLESAVDAYMKVHILGNISLMRYVHFCGIYHVHHFYLLSIFEFYEMELRCWNRN